AAGAFVAHCPTPTGALGAWPWGGGRGPTAHGPLPVPAPATRRLVRGLAGVDDGVAGERVTPTGAAIVKYLASARGGILGQARAGPVGMGAGTCDMAAIANVLRVAAYDDPGVTDADDLVAALACEIDDMTGEELAAAADHLRACDGVLDVSLFAGTGKKGRPVTALRLLCRPEVAAATAAAVLDSTSTLGLRHRLERRWVLARDLALVGADGVRVKIAQRPNGTASAKAEADDLPAPTHARRRAAAAAESAALSKPPPAAKS
ncbi:MAG: nickel insertion protein, partial [Pseudomonadota bacterium]|nr:nickel insertion protein [Pseudomonadota bacterium]